MQWSAVAPAGDLVIGAFGLADGELVSESRHALQQGIVAAQAGQIHLGQFERADLATADELSQLRDRVEGGFFQIGGAGHGGLSAHGGAARDGRGLGGGGVDLEVQRHGHAVVEIGGADALVLFAAARDDLEHLLALGGCEAQAEQGFGGGDLLGGDGGFGLGH